ncbi:NUDIX hydrolase [Simiduia curdlanivorans]|uniref:NUDIX domain-containing protein n=1 Tax=Simiduia curdlanivorans TaxID=1492769 RepID=A0ABV8VAV2_9GAMM|nr:NUDIX hydrolase [Simiduia curdlanivorans]MDN3639835.1 NUDIX hydrolase [Simiduia curdlanivorans]
MDNYWAPHITVAVILEQDGKYLFVRENTDQGIRINQPAGHVEAGESLAQAACRETLEETGYKVTLAGFVSLSSYTAPSNGTTYFRATFSAKDAKQVPGARLDPDIIEPIWLSREELEQQKAAWRSPLVADVLDQYIKHGAQSLELGTLHR